MTRIAFICLGSYHIPSFTKEQNFVRQSTYAIALNQVLFLADHTTTQEKKLTCDFFLVENTVSDTSSVITELQDQFSHPHIKDVLYINNNNLGSKSKGAGEYTMCQAIIDKHKDVLQNYDWIIYYTLRQTIFAPCVLNTIANLTDEENGASVAVVVGNPDFLFSTGTVVPSASGNYCDMIFAMKPDQFFRYIKSLSPEDLIAKNINSEANLFNFIRGEEKKGIQKIKLDRLGVMRYDYAINVSQIV